MNARDWISIFLAIPLLSFEYTIIKDHFTIGHYLALHLITVLILFINVFLAYLMKENLLYPLLLLSLASIAGPFGIGTFLLMATLRPVFYLFATSSTMWLEGLFPKNRKPLFEQIIERIKSRWDDYERQGEVSPFQNLFTYGSLFDKQKVLDAIIENFSPSYSPILKEALKDPQNLVRIQSAAIVTKINTDFEEGLKKREKAYFDSPQKKESLLLLAEYMDNYALMGILDDIREMEVASLAVRYYRDYLKSDPNNLIIWMATARLLFHQKDYESFQAWYEEGIQRFGIFPKIVNTWNFECLYKLNRLDKLTKELENF